MVLDTVLKIEEKLKDGWSLEFDKLSMSIYFKDPFGVYYTISTLQTLPKASGFNKMDSHNLGDIMAQAIINSHIEKNKDLTLDDIKDLIRGNCGPEHNKYLFAGMLMSLVNEILSNDSST